MLLDGFEGGIELTVGSQGNALHVADAFECFSYIFEDMNINSENFGNINTILTSSFVSELIEKLIEMIRPEADDRVRVQALSCLTNLTVSENS